MIDKSRQTAFLVLLDFEKGVTKPVDGKTNSVRLDTRFQTVARSQKLTGRDKAFASELVYGVTRWRRSLDLVISRYSRTPPKKLTRQVLVLLRMALYQMTVMEKVWAHAAVNETVNLAKKDHKAKHFARFINGTLRAMARELEPLLQMVRATKITKSGAGEIVGNEYSLPGWLAQRWVKNFGEQKALEFAEGSNCKAPLFLRMNRLATEKAAFEEKLRNSGYTFEPFRFCDDAYTITDGPPFTPDSPLFKRGLTQPQDGSSIVAASLLSPKPGDTVADICCGKGIKTGFFLERMENRGTLFAMDSSFPGLKELSINMSRLGHKAHRAVMGDAGRPWPVNRRFDHIFIDAPCSSTGVIRRHPEIKWNRTEEFIHKMADIQKKIVTTAIDYLAPSGRMVYSVCSLEPEEGIDRVEEALETHKDITRMDIREINPALADITNRSGDLFVQPGAFGMDGFFSSALVKAG